MVRSGTKQIGGMVRSGTKQIGGFIRSKTYNKKRRIKKYNRKGGCNCSMKI